MEIKPIAKPFMVKTQQLLKNPSTLLPSTLQGFKNPAIAVFWP
jgi:hypothetical protein